MLRWALTFFILALIAGFLGFFGLAGLAAGIARILLLAFLVLFVLSILSGAFRGRSPTIWRKELAGRSERCGRHCARNDPTGGML